MTHACHPVRARRGWGLRGARLVVATISLIACRERDIARHGRAANRSSGAAPNARVFAAGIVDTLWTAPVVRADEAGAPQSIAADGRTVYVGDATAHRVLALDAHDGHRRWSTDARPDATLRALVPLDIVARRHGGVFVTDGPDGSVVELDDAGKLVRSFRLPFTQHVQPFCVLPDGSLIASQEAANRGLIRVLPTGETRGPYALPWAVIRDTNPLLAQVTFAPSRDGCVVSLSLGLGFAQFVNDSFRAPVPYIEPTPLPRITRLVRAITNGTTVSTFVEDHDGGATAIAATRDRIVVAFGGHSADRNHLLDAYDLDGRYLQSYRTGRVVSAVAANDSALFVLTHDRGLPVVVALRWPVAPAPNATAGGH